MKKFYFSYLSSNGITTINAVKWLPETAPRGIVQIAHGVTEYIERYDNLASVLTSHGYIVVGNDHLGHGRSITNGQKMYMGPIGSWNYAVYDLKQCTDLIQKEYSNLPIYLLGFSLGSFLVRNYLSDYNPRIYKVFLIGTGYQPNWLISLIKPIVKSEIKKYGPSNSSKKVNDLSFGTYNKKIKNPKTPYDWLSSSDISIKSYIEDPMINKELTTSLFLEMLNGIAYTSSNKCINKMNKSIPIILLSGQDDPVGDMAKGVTKYFNILKKKGFKTAITLFPKMRHDLFHEEHSEKVYETIVSYLK